MIRVEQMLLSGAERRGLEKGMERGMQKGIEIGILRIASNLKKQNVPFEIIAQSTGLTLSEIEKL